MVPFHIIADDREARSGTLEVLQGVDGVELKVRRLPLGDYLWEGGLLFERKTLRDFVAGIKNGRLLRQACRLAYSRHKTILILEGTELDLATSRMSREAIQGALISITIVLGIPLLRAKDPEETTRLMLYAARQIRGFAGRPIPRPFYGRRSRGKRRTQLEILQGIPGIGPEKATWLLHTFGSVESIFAASSQDLRRAKGIGTETAEAIRWAVAEPPPKWEAGEPMPW